jgi:hypothetical protein
VKRKYSILLVAETNSWSRSHPTPEEKSELIKRAAEIDNSAGCGANLRFRTQFVAAYDNHRQQMHRFQLGAMREAKRWRVSGQGRNLTRKDGIARTGNARLWSAVSAGARAAEVGMGETAAFPKWSGAAVYASVFSRPDCVTSSTASRRPSAAIQRRARRVGCGGWTKSATRSTYFRLSIRTALRTVTEHRTDFELDYKTQRIRRASRWRSEKRKRGEVDERVAKMSAFRQQVYRFVATNATVFTHGDRTSPNVSLASCT